MADDSGMNGTAPAAQAVDDKPAAAAKPEAPAPESPESPTLADLLKQFEEAEEAEPSSLPPGTKTTSELHAEIESIDAEWEAAQPAMAEARRLEAEKAQQRERADLEAAANYLKTRAKAPASIPQRLVRGFVREYVAETPGALDAWENRHAQPAAWNGHLRQIVSQFPQVWSGKESAPASRHEHVAGNDIGRALASLHAANSRPIEPVFDPAEAFHWPEDQWREFCDREAAKGDRLRGRR